MFIHLYILCIFNDVCNSTDHTTSDVGVMWK